ncbi:Uncharacterised protein [Mycobacteroides abscessus subsp. massiliense]|nr:Uncharacterised protein [Mycobacteroides abscessus subsp. massiliense]
MGELLNLLGLRLELRVGIGSQLRTLPGVVDPRGGNRSPGAHRISSIADTPRNPLYQRNSVHRINRTRLSARSQRGPRLSSRAEVLRRRPRRLPQIHAVRDGIGDIAGQRLTQLRTILGQRLRIGALRLSLVRQVLLVLLAAPRGGRTQQQRRQIIITRLIIAILLLVLVVLLLVPGRGFRQLLIAVLPLLTLLLQLFAQIINALTILPGLLLLILQLTRQIVDLLLIGGLIRRLVGLLPSILLRRLLRCLLRLLHRLLCALIRLHALRSRIRSGVEVRIRPTRPLRIRSGILIIRDLSTMRGLIPALLRPLLPAGTLNPLITDRRSLRVIDRDRAVLIQRRLIDPTLIIRHLTRHLRRLKLRSIRPIGATIGATPTIRRTLRMRLRDGGLSKPTQTQPTRREHQQRNNTRHRGRLMRSISSPLPQTRKTFPPTQIGPHTPNQHRDNRSDRRQHVGARDRRCQLRGQPRRHHHERQPTADKRGHQTRMPQPLRNPAPARRPITLDQQTRLRERLPDQAGHIPATSKQRSTGKNRHQHLANPQRQ